MLVMIISNTYECMHKCRKIKVKIKVHISEKGDKCRITFVSLHLQEKKDMVNENTIIHAEYKGWSIS